jgi:subtilase family serine protease
MKRRLVLVVTGCMSLVALLGAPSQARPAAKVRHVNAHVCAVATAGSAACLATRHDTTVNGKVAPDAVAWTSGYGAADLQSAYALTSASSTGGLGNTVAIVDAYNDPTAAGDLAVYRNTMGLPATTTCRRTSTSIASSNPSRPCFAKVNQSGGASSYPVKNGGWAQEISLDLDMVSAVCPNCNVLLVEANNSSFINLAAAVAYASKLAGVVAISNSYGGSDSANMTAYEKAVTTYHKAVTASTGDDGYGVEAPASFSHVVAVGGTQLVRDDSARGWAETAWDGAGSGCSTRNSDVWQDNAATGCSNKATADVSAVADPNSGVAVYDSTAYQGYVGWLVFGGTSVASPIIASVYVLANDFGATAGEWTWSHASGLNDVTAGSNGSCSTATWCTAGVGWDGPTGLGTPNGTAAF